MFDFEFSIGGRRETLGDILGREQRQREAQRAAELLEALVSNPTKVRVTVRTTVEEATVMGVNRGERTRVATIELVPGLKLAKSEIEPGVFGDKITTVAIEGLDHLDLPVVTNTTERDTIFGKHIVTEVFIASQGDAQFAQSRPTIRERVTIKVRRPSRPTRSSFGF